MIRRAVNAFKTSAIINKVIFIVAGSALVGFLGVGSVGAAARLSQVSGHPTDPAQCSSNGFQNFSNPGFSSENECLSFVANEDSGYTTNISNNNNVNVTNSNNQNVSSGEAEVSGNTTGGSATSGSASASNTTSTSVNISNNNSVSTP